MCRLFVVSLAAVAVAFCVQLISQSSYAPTGGHSDTGSSVPAQHVPQFDASSPSLREALVHAVDIGSPFVLKECLGSNCSAAFQRFATVVPGCLANEVELKFRHQTRPLFRNINFDMADAAGIRVADFQYKPISVEDAFYNSSVDVDCRFCYVSEPLNESCRAEVAKDPAVSLYWSIVGAAATDVQRRVSSEWHAGDPMRLLTADGSREAFAENVWMGTRGVMALMHYDQVLNFFTQIKGRKRFLLVRDCWCGDWCVFLLSLKQETHDG